MPYKWYVTLVGSMLLFTACSSVPEEDFFIVQNGTNHAGDEVSIKREAFTVVSKTDDFGFVLAPKPIYMLADHKDIVKLVGTGVAWNKGDGLLYKASSLLSDTEACDAYFGYQGKGCKTYIKRKTALGFRKHYAYTFSVLYVPKKKWLLERLNEVEISKRKENVYYLYLFKQTDSLGQVAFAEHVTRIKINIEE